MKLEIPPFPGSLKMIIYEASSISHIFSTKVTYQTKSAFLTPRHLRAPPKRFLSISLKSGAVSLKSYIYFPLYCVVWCVCARAQFSLFLSSCISWLQVKTMLQKRFYVHLRVQGLWHSACSSGLKSRALNCYLRLPWWGLLDP